jgi:hypothetical protein
LRKRSACNRNDNAQHSAEGGESLKGVGLICHSCKDSTHIFSDPSSGYRDSDKPHHLVVLGIEVHE